jgi:hypothetical protein
VVTGRSALFPSGATTDRQSDSSEAAPTPRAHHLALVATLVAAGALVLGTIGPPLFGQGVFLTDDTIFYAYPWRALESPAALDVQDHGPTTDTVDVVYPTRATFGDAARAGDFLAWDPLVAGGMAVGSESTSGVLNPFAWLFVLLPAWYAPAAIKLGVMAAALGFTYLFCRRVGTTRIPALFAGMAYAGSGFVVMWTNWYHPEVAALIPALFWATERYLQRPGVRAAVPIALSLSAMLVAGFPAVVGFALYVLAGYVVLRLVASRDRSVRRRIAVAGGAGAGVVAGVLLVAAVVLPFASHLGDLDLSAREETPDRNLGLASLVTGVAPTALGLSSNGPDAHYFGPHNQVEAISFVGATTALAAVIALCLAAPRAMPPGVRGAMAAAAVGLGAATFAGGFPLRLLQQLPVFSDNFIGRTRSILGFTVAVLAALGLQAVMERRSPVGRRGWLMVGIVAATTAAVAALAGVRALDLARHAQRTGVLRSGLVLPLVVGAATVALLVVVWSGRASLRVAGLCGIAALLVVESLRLSLPLLPNEDRDHLYPTTSGIEFLDRHLGGDRVAPEGFTLFGTAATLYGIRTVSGHTFYATTWKQALLAADPDAFDRSPTYPALRGDARVMTSPMLDRLGVRWFAASAVHPPPGRVEDHGLRGATCERPVVLSSTQVVTLAAGDGLRGLVVQPCGSTPPATGSALRIQVDAAGGSAVGRERFTGTVTAAQPLSVAVPAEELHGHGDARVTLALEGADRRSLPLATTPTGELAFEAIRPTADHLRLAFADDLRIYERTAALPRIRWAGRAIVITDPDRRLARLASGTVDPDTVVLSDPPGEGDAAARPPGAGATEASVTVTSDAEAAIRVTVDADGPGHLVVADALQKDWVATIDGSPAPLVAADHAGVAVDVPAGRHDVALRYRPRRQRLGLAISSSTAVALLAALVADTVSRRARAADVVGRR